MTEVTSEKTLIHNTYNALKEGTGEVQKLINQVNEYDAKISSGKYSDNACTEYRNEIMHIKRELQNKSEKLEKNCYSMIDQYIEYLRSKDDLNPNDINDDIKLLNCGISLNDYDIKCMLERNKNNVTMSKLISRYAHEHDIKLEHEYVTGASKDIERVNGLRSVIYYYVKNWINKSNCYEMLDKFYTF